MQGMLLLCLSVYVPSLKPPECSNGTCQKASSMQVGIFFTALYIIALDSGAVKPNISTVGADQFDESDPTERRHKLSFFNWWMFSVFVRILLSHTVMVYIQDISWSVGYGIMTLGLTVSTAVFLAGTPSYRHKVPQGSPFTRMGKVVAAALWKWRAPLPTDTKELHELDLEFYTKKRKHRIDSTNTMRFLNRTAVKDPSQAEWTLCTVTQVEATEHIVKLIPFHVTLLVPCAFIAQTSTLFVKQGTTLDRHVGPHFQIPPASLAAFVTLAMLVGLVVYDRWLAGAAQKYTTNPRGITLLQRTGTGMLIQVMAMTAASVIESRRLSYARRHGLDRTGGQLPLTIFILLPQLVLMGTADAFLVVGKIEFFYDQAPDSMKSLGTAMSLTAYGVGDILSSVLLSLVTRTTQSKGNAWVTNNLNASCLDYYYSFLAVLGMVNFLAFVVLSKRYTYRAELAEPIEMEKEEQGGQIGKS